jgi:glycosyltransferase involved in cell wall biosynthesis
MKQISCIIPAYNEGSRIAGVLDVACAHPLLHEVIVVDDGSSDDTRAVVARYAGARLIAREKNAGKSSVVVEGIRQSTGDLFILLDADLAGLSTEAITALITPVQTGNADISISLRANAPAWWQWIGIDFISGERVFTKEFISPLLEHISHLEGFGLEVYMNRHIVKNRLRIAIVRINVRSAFKFVQQQAWWYLGMNKDYLRMAGKILHTVSIFEVVSQISTMRGLRTADSKYTV